MNDKVHRRLSGLVTFIVSAAVVSQIGCEPEPPKMPSFKKGGQVRVLNLSSQPINAWIAGQEAAVNLEQGKHGGMRLTSLKKKDIKVDAGGKTVFTGELLCESDQVYTIAAFNEGKRVSVKIVSGEPKLGSGDSAKVVVVNLCDKPGTVSVNLVAGGKTVKYSSVAKGSTSKEEVVPAGKVDWTVAVGSAQTKGTGEVVKGEGNTIFVFSSDGRVKSLLFSNKPKIVIAGPSGGTPMN